MGRILYDEAQHPGSRIRVPLKTIISPIFPPDQSTDHTWGNGHMDMDMDMDMGTIPVIPK